MLDFDLREHDLLLAADEDADWSDNASDGDDEKEEEEGDGADLGGDTEDDWDEGAGGASET